MTTPLWVTGLGLVTALGTGVESTWSALLRGERAIVPVTLFDVAEQRVRIVGEVRGVARLPGPERTPDIVSRTNDLALLAARECIAAARLDVRALRVGLVVGTTTGGMLETEKLLARLCAEPAERRPRPELASHPLSATGDCLNDALGPFQRVRVLASACSSGANAIALAATWLLSGEVDAVVAGGADALCRLTLSGFNALGALDPTPCRPFDRQRRGTNLGEGAGFLVIERREHARGRKVEPVAELAGWAIGSEAHHVTNPAPDGVVAALLMERAMARAGLVPRDVDYISAHGTGTLQNDAMEAVAIRRALGNEVHRVPVSSSKAQMGHTLGAAGAIEAAVTALVISRRVLVPTAGLDEPDPSMDLVHVPHVGRGVPRVRAALSNAFGFGGMNTVLAFTEPGSHGGRPRRSTADAAFPNDERAAPPLDPGPAVITGVALFGHCGLLGPADCAAVPRAAFDRDAVVNPYAYLDGERSRRLDRAAGIGAVAVQRALAEARRDGSLAGLTVGTAYGNVDACAFFLQRIFDKGPRAASPAEFPNLVPSSPVGHVSIYLGMQGPAFATLDLATSGESAFAEALALVAAGESEAVVAGAIGLRSDIVDRALSPSCPGAPSLSGAVRTDLAAAIVVESERVARARTAPILARISQLVTWRGPVRDALARLAAPRGKAAELVLSRSLAADVLLAVGAWTACHRIDCATVFGEGDALGGAALAVAAARVTAAGEILVVGAAGECGYAVVLEAP